MKNLKKVAKRIKEAVKNNEKIVLYCDGDLDGVVSVIVLEETIREMKGKVSVYVSDREKWGYGLSKKATLYMKKESPALLISLDCGITNFDGAKEAKKQKLELIIIDHHKALGKMPIAKIILDPMQKGDKYPFKKLANAGIVYKLAEEILRDDFSEKKDEFLEIVALATIADMMPKEEDNKKILDEGLKLLENPQNKSLHILKKKFKKEFLDKTVSLLNVSKAKGKVNKTYLFLKTKKEEVAKKILKEMEKDQKERKKKMEIEQKRLFSKIKEEDVIVFEEGKFPSSLAGSLASKIIRKYKKPVFLYVKEKDGVRGSVRVLSGQDSVDAMSSCKKHLLSFGGHAPAAGFILEEKSIEDFKSCLIKYFKNK
jgi:single-stranded-DNA-specific exonuclease